MKVINRLALITAICALGLIAPSGASALPWLGGTCELHGSTSGGAIGGSCTNLPGTATCSLTSNGSSASGPCTISSPFGVGQCTFNARFPQYRLPIFGRATVPVSDTLNCMLSTGTTIACSGNGTGTINFAGRIDATINQGCRITLPPTALGRPDDIPVGDPRS